MSRSQAASRATPSGSALLTPVGEGGIAVIAVWGDGARAAVEKLFRPGSRRHAGLAKGKLHYGHLVEREETIDEVILSPGFPPHSPTGLEEVEINCHGGIVAAGLVLAALARHGFPERAACEYPMAGARGPIERQALMDVVRAPTLRAAALLAEQASGALSRELAELARRAERLAQSAESGNAAADGVEELSRRAAHLEASGRLGLALVDPPRVAILGRPNAGKSSLFNALLGIDRTIVMPEAGTTRDAVEATAGFEGFAVTLVDTAGLAEFATEVDRAAVERTWLAVEESRAALYLVEVERAVDSEENDLIERVRAEVPTILVRTKCDLGETRAGPAGLAVSSTTGHGLRELEGSILEALFGEWRSVTGGALVFTETLAATVGRAAREFAEAAAGAGSKDPVEAALHLRRGAEAVGELMSASHNSA